MRESVPRQVDKMSGVPEEERGIWSFRWESGILKEEESTNFLFFFSTFLSLSCIKWLFSLSPELMIT